jgi:AmmeMemoRadiSam system protein A
MPAQEPIQIHALTEAQKHGLLRVARSAIAAHWTGAPPAQVEALGLEEVFAGVFVSLHIEERLRGCIGYVEGLRPLPEVVQETAIAAAFRDPRFEPLAPEELDLVEIEISVLSPLHQIESPGEIQLGKHGVLVRLGKQQGLLLPQVTTHSDWDVETFLAHVCLKAGLSSEAWKDPDAEIYLFEAEIFAEAPISDPNG